MGINNPGQIQSNSTVNNLTLTGTTTLPGSGSISSGGVLTLPAQPAFLAYQSARVLNVTGNGTTYTVLFDSEVFDQSGSYNPATGIFTAPVTGRYHFDTNVETLGYGGAHTYCLLELVASNRTARLVGTIYGAGAINTQVGGNQFDTGGSILIDMDANDTAKITVAVAGSTLTVAVDGAGTPRTYFSGNLVA